MDFVSMTKIPPDFASGARNRILAFAVAKNESTSKKIEKALSVLETDGRGASVAAIVNWILSNYAILDPQKLKVSVKRAVLKGLQDGSVVRTRGSKGAQGVAGSFKLPSKKTPKKDSKSDRKSKSFQVLIPLTITKDGLLIQASKLNGIKRKASATRTENDTRSEKSFSKSGRGQVLDSA